MMYANEGERVFIKINLQTIKRKLTCFTSAHLNAPHISNNEYPIKDIALHLFFYMYLKAV